jgi:hypothetical protein
MSSIKTPPPPPPLAYLTCRCGSDRFAALGKLLLHKAMAEPPVMYQCAFCSDVYRFVNGMWIRSDRSLVMRRGPSL